MKKRWLVASVLVYLSLFGLARLGLAQEDAKLSNDVLTSMLEQGWKIVQDGVLQRELRSGEVESFVFGAPGFTWKLRDLQQQLQRLQKTFREDPTPELRSAIANHRKEIANTRKLIEIARAADADESGAGKVSCSINFGYDASASYLTSAQGTFGNASANFSSNCAFSGEVYAYAQATVTVNGGPTTKTVTDGPRSGASVSATAYASLNGGSPCDSYAYASMTSNSLNPSSYSMAATNSVCPVSNPVPTINGVNYIYVSACTTTTWTSSVSGGTTPYTYQWTWNGVAVGTGSSYSRTICPGAVYSYTTNTLALTVTDSGGRTGSASKSVAVEKDPPVSDPTCGSTRVCL